MAFGFMVMGMGLHFNDVFKLEFNGSVFKALIF